MLLKLYSISRFHIVAIAALATLVFGWALTGERLWLVMGLSALDWFLLNMLNRVTDVEEDLENGIIGAPVVAAHPRAFTIGGLGVMALAIAVVHPIAPGLTAWRLLFHAMGIAYNWKVLPGQRRFKEMYFWKNSASAILFLISGFAYPLALGHALLPDVNVAMIVGTMAFFVPYELSYEVIYDLRDLPGDTKAGVPTYPVIHGRQTAERIVWGLIFGSVAILIPSYLAGVVPWRIVVMVVAPITQIIWFGLARKRGITAFDCVGITWLGALLLGAYQVWIALGLPGSTLPT